MGFGVKEKLLDEETAETERKKLALSRKIMLVVEPIEGQYMFYRILTIIALLVFTGNSYAEPKNQRSRKLKTTLQTRVYPT